MAEQPSVSPAAIRDLVDAGDGFARIIDPETKRCFFVQEEVEVALPDQYINEKLEEARQSLRAGHAAKVSTTDDVIAEAKRRLARSGDSDQAST